MPRRLSPLAAFLLVPASYAALTLVFNWPLPLVLGDRLTGSIAGDTGVYVWNLWVFRHEAIVHHRFPLFTQEVLSLTPPVDLSLHNYTLFADIVAFPLVPWLGVIASFNIVYLIFVAATAWAMYALARSVTRKTPEAWLAGVLFAFCPVLMARATAHFSLSAAAPLPLFLLALRRAERDGDLRFAVLAGATAAWSSMWDAYYGIFCILIAAAYFATARVRLRPALTSPHYLRRIRISVNLAIVALLSAIGGILVSGVTEIEAAGQTIRVRPLYNPILAVTVLIGVRLWLRNRPGLRLVKVFSRQTLFRVGAYGVGCTLVLLPIIYAFSYSLADGADLHGPLYWRSSPPGIDLLSFLVPNPNHAWAGDTGRKWLDGLPNGYVENVASIPVVGLLILAVAVIWTRFRPAKVWILLTVFLGLLSLGPFVHVAGIDTHIPGPWAILRYVPVLTATRTPTRYVIPFMMAFSLLFALALARITTAYPRYRAAILCVVAVALIIELSPFPRALYPAEAPDVYRIIAEDPRDVTVLDLPFGFRSGEWSQGNFTAASQFYQTVHEKKLIGGYLSRIGQQELERLRASITVRHLIRLSEGQQLSQKDADELKQRARGFVDRSRLGYVVIETAITPPLLRQLAIEAYGLTKLADGGGFELFAPTVSLIAHSH